jgi:hypothetical protein
MIELRYRGEWSEPVYDAICIACGAVYEESLGGMLRACSACTLIVLPSFDQHGGFARDNFIALCHAIIASGNAALPDEDVWRRCHFCGRKTNLDISTMFYALHFCPTCLNKLPAWNARSYLTLF